MNRTRGFIGLDRLRSRRARAAALPSMLSLAAMLALPSGEPSAQARQTLFDGKTLIGWHTQGEGLWSVSEGAIHARNPKKDWAHLITDQSFQNGYVRIRFFNRAGNSGLYVRGSDGGIYGHKGMQVDIGAPHKDGSVMRVTDSAYAWYAEITKAADSGYLKPDAWNEMAVDIQGTGLKTYINGHLIWSGANLAGIAAAGNLALQLHSGDDNDISFKDLVVLTPTRVPYCPTPGDPANRPGNDPDSSLCKPVTLAPPRGAGPGDARHGRAQTRIGRIAVNGWIPGRSMAPAYGFRIERETAGEAFDLRGARLPAPSRPSAPSTPSIPLNETRPEARMESGPSQEKIP